MPLHAQWQAVKKLDILTYDREYFKITSGLERRLYEIFRKHCGKQAKWSISEENLYHKVGSKGGIRKFRYVLKNIGGEITGYKFVYESGNIDVYPSEK